MCGRSWSTSKPLVDTVADKIKRILYLDLGGFVATAEHFRKPVVSLAVDASVRNLSAAKLIRESPAWVIDGSDAINARVGFVKAHDSSDLHAQDPVVAVLVDLQTQLFTGTGDSIFSCGDSTEDE